jgi:hypothetical protein
MAAAVLATLLLTVIGLVASGNLATGVSPATVAGPTRIASAASTSLDCNPTGTPSPSALYINTNEPKVNLANGGTITSTMEFAVVNYTAADFGVLVYFPTVDFTFPLSPTGNFTITVTPQTLAIAGAGWTSGAGTNRSAVEHAGLNFPSGGKARLSTQKVAVQADVPYGQITLEFRWMWQLDQPNGSVTRSAWTTPKSTYSGPPNLPSIFFPAQYTQFVSGAGNGAHVTIGTNYSATLSGPVGGRFFFLEMENGVGHVVKSHGTTFAANATSGNVTIPLLNYDNYLPPGLYLVHIHDACGAILYNKLVNATFAPSATLTFYLSPSTCGPMTFDGTSFANGASGTFTPSSTPYAFTVPKCAGYAFSNWTDTGGLHISSSDRLIASYNGTLTIDYKVKS